MTDGQTAEPDDTAVRVALWRALHVQADPPPHVIEDVAGPGHAELRTARNGAGAAGTPFISFFTPPEMPALICEAGFEDARHVSAAMLDQGYFADRTDGLGISSGEELLVAGV